MDSDSDTENDIIKLQAALERSVDKRELPVKQKVTAESVPKSVTVIKFKRAIDLNSECDSALEKLQQKLAECLEKCNQKLYLVQCLLKSSSISATSVDKNPQLNYYQCGMPFFKDADHFPAPRNSDTGKIRACGIRNDCHMYMFNGWTPTQKQNLQEKILKLIRRHENRECSYTIKKLTSEISKSSKTNTESKKKLIEELNEQQKKLKNIHKTPLSALAKGLDEDEDGIDWDELGGTRGIEHSAGECRSIWRQVLHPSINQQPWSQTEAQKLLHIASEMGNQDWEHIAKVLGTGRSAYLCFLFYRLQLTKRPIASRWTPQEDDYLRRVIENCRIGDLIPWAKVAYFVEDRTKEQIYHHWIYHLKPARQGKFSPEEDMVLLAAVREMGQNFTSISKFLNNRNPSSLKIRFLLLQSYLSFSQAVWTQEEDTLLYKLITLANESYDNINYNALSVYFKNKPVHSLAPRVTELKNWLLLNPDKSLSDIPQKSVFHPEYLQSNISLKDALTHLPAISIEEETVPKFRKYQTSKYRLRLRQINVKLIKHFEDKLRKQYIFDEIPTDYNVKILDLKDMLSALGAKLNDDLIKKNSVGVGSSLQNLAKELISSKEITNTNTASKIIKTYSRKKAIMPQKSENLMDSNDFSVSNDQYVIPPSYNSVTAFTKIMLNKMSDNRIDNSLTTSLNEKINIHLNVFERRFDTLFTWPVNLSNIEPCIASNLFAVNENIPLSCNDNHVNEKPLLTMDELMQDDKAYITPKVKRIMIKKNKRKPKPKLKAENDIHPVTTKDLNHRRKCKRNLHTL